LGAYCAHEQECEKPTENRLSVFMLHLSSTTAFANGIARDSLTAAFLLSNVR
jgi:hypothetical protein